MPIIPSKSAIVPAIASITNVNEVLATDLSYTVCIVRTFASGRLAFTDHTACRTSLRNPCVPARSLLITNVTVRVGPTIPGPNRSLVIVGQYTISGALACTPFSRTSWITPITSRHELFGNSRNLFPTAADGEPHNSRARFSEISDTGLNVQTSVHVRSRPATIRVPAVAQKPGEMYLYKRKGAISSSE